MSSTVILGTLFYLGNCILVVCVCAKSLQFCLTLCDLMDCSPPGSSVHWVSQARILEWVSMPSSKDLPNPGIKPVSLSLVRWWAGSLPLVPPGNPILVAPILTFKLCDIFTENSWAKFLLAQLMWSLPHCRGLQATLASSLCSINSGFLPAPKTCSMYSRCLHFLLLLILLTSFGFRIKQCQSYVYTILQSAQCIVPFCLETVALS